MTRPPASPADLANGISELTHGNLQRARELRADLAVYARRTDNPTIRRMVADVLAGRRNVHEVLRSPEFNQTATAALDKIERGLAQLTEEQRAHVSDRTRPRTPHSILTSMRDAYDPGGSLVPEAGSNDDRGPIMVDRCDETAAPADTPAAAPPTPARARRPRPASDDEDDEPRETFLKRDW